ncbi:MAG: T9SS type A sorting domain-containing protein, partial [Clostridiales bacterium]|nr:T9SS type A sorting domain-containing protein [Clostridiales bacterium]
QTYYGKGWHGYRALGTGGNHVLNPEGDHEHTHPREWTVDGGDRGPRPVSAKNFTELEEEAGNPELHVFNDLLSRGYIDAQGNVLSTFDMYNYDDFVIDETYANVRSKIFVVLRQHLADPPIIGLNSDIRAEYYRLGNALAWVGTAMSAILMETTDEWGHQPYFDYIDRWMNEDYYAYEDTLIKYCSRRVGIENGWIDRDYRITYYTNANPSHALDRLMWEEYRLDYDTTAPTTPVISLAGKTLTQVDISIDAWDSYGVYYYRIFRDGNFLCEVSESYYSDTGLTPYTEYTYTATAYDIAGNESDLSEPLQVTTSDIDEISDMNHGIFEIYPNPASSLIFLESFSTTSLYFELYTVTGIKLLQQTISIKKQTIDISKFSEGIYVYKVYAADNHYKSGMLMINR